MSFEFKKESKGENGVSAVVIMKTDAILIGEILEAFEDFLRGCGFFFDGHVVIEEESGGEG